MDNEHLNTIPYKPVENNSWTSILLVGIQKCLRICLVTYHLVVRQKCSERVIYAINHVRLLSWWKTVLAANAPCYYTTLTIETSVIWDAIALIMTSLSCLLAFTVALWMTLMSLSETKTYTAKIKLQRTCYGFYFWTAYLNRYRFFCFSIGRTT